MIQSLKPFLSSADIQRGDRWSEALATELQHARFSIICITRYNISKPWMNFEAGALSKFVGSSSVAPFLFYTDPSSVKGPLSQFQTTSCAKDEFFNLLLTINNKLKPGKRLTYEILSQNFDHWWEKLENSLNSINCSQANETETEHNWLYTQGDIIRTEKKPDYKSIWIITPNPFAHALKSEVKRVVMDNLERGVKYTYIVPASGIDEQLSQIQEMANSYKDRLIIKTVDNACFKPLAVTDCMIMNPDNDGSSKLRTFLRLPVSENFWAEVTDEMAAIGFKTRFEKWARGEGCPPIESHSPDSSTESIQVVR